MKKGKVTICIGTVGSPTFEKCKNTIYKHFENHPLVDKIVIIKDKSPQSAWLNEMRKQCADTEWCLQVDEDMYLRPNALDELIKLYKEEESKGIKILNASSLLYDLFLERNIGSLKLWNSSALQELEFKDVLGGDRDFAKRASSKGYQNVETKLVLGDHDSAPNPAIAFSKYHEYVQKIRKFSGEKSAEIFLSSLKNKYERDKTNYINKKAYDGAKHGINKPIKDVSKRALASGNLSIEFSENSLSLSEGFSKIYCINLERHPVRKKRMLNLLSDIGVSDFIFFPAHDFKSKKVKATYSRLSSSSILKKKKRPGALGCLMSHISVIEDAIKNKYDSILILEDDIIPRENARKIISNIRLPKNWKMLYFGSNMAGLWEYSRDVNKDFFISTKVNGTYAYALHSSAYKDVLMALKTLDGPVDWLLHRYAEKIGGALCLKSQIFAPLIFSSEIGDYHRGDILSFYKKMKINIKNYDISSVIDEKESFVIGLGTGRCGSQSLSHLLNSQSGVTVYHEKNDKLQMPTWKFNEELIKTKLLEICLSSNDKIVGDIGMYYLPYVLWLKNKFSNFKFIALKRNIDEVVPSYDKKIANPGPNGRNHWVDHDGKYWALDKVWDRQYPSFNYIKETKSRIPYILEYCKYYEKELKELKILTFNTNDLNSEIKVNEMLDYIGVKNKKIIYSRKNRLLS